MRVLPTRRHGRGRLLAPSLQLFGLPATTDGVSVAHLVLGLSEISAALMT